MCRIEAQKKVWTLRNDVLYAIYFRCNMFPWSKQKYPSSVQIMAWCLTGDISTMALFTYAYILHSPWGVLKFKLWYQCIHNELDIIEQFKTMKLELDKHVYELGEFQCAYQTREILWNYCVVDFKFTLSYPAHTNHLRCYQIVYLD